MKKILITGKNSYIGNSIKKWLQTDQENYYVETIDLKNKLWKDNDFSKYETVIHTAGVAHIKETDDNRELYFKVNRDLAYEVALISKKAGVSHFIFISTMSVYGVEKGVITKKTLPKPKTAYGQSKLEGEKMVSELEDDSFIISIIRPPMVYGKGCKGNYPRLSKLAKKLPVFPNIKNNRSMIFINNLSEFIKNIVDKKIKGILFPQNKEFVNTSEMFYLISRVNGKNVRLTKIFNPILNLFKYLNIGIINKVFGDLTYEKNMSSFELNYIVSEFEESINLTEKH